MKTSSKRKGTATQEKNKIPEWCDTCRVSIRHVPRNLVFIAIISLCLISCSEIKPMVLPAYNPPDLSSIKRPEIPMPQEGKDYTIDVEKNTITYTITGQDLLTAKVISEKAAWTQIEMLIQMVGIQSEMIKQDRELIIIIDLKRQYAERQKTYADIEKYVSWVISLIAIALTLAK